MLVGSAHPTISCHAFKYFSAIDFQLFIEIYPTMLILHHPKLLDFMRADYSVSDIQQLFEFLKNQGTFQFPSLENGLFAAALLKSDTEYTDYTSVWVRDNLYIAHAHYVLGEVEIALKTVNALISYFNKHQWRFIKIIEGEVDPQNVMERPHVRFDGKNLAEINQKWAHAQNDALGFFLWFYCQLATQGLLNPEADDFAVLALFPHYFQAIRYWQDEDSGHWEETRKLEASSIGGVVAGLKALQTLLNQREKWSEIQECDRAFSPPFLTELIAHGESTLKTILPAECIQPKPKKNRRYDTALLFLIYPLQLVPETTANQILDNIITHLQGDYGIRRYLGDSYWCANYKKKLPPPERTRDWSESIEERDRLLADGEQAQWCVFDPILSIIFGLKFQQSQQPHDFQQQIYYLNRSLGQITGKDSEFGEFKCPELYHREDDHYVPSDATPLLWTQANLAVALKMMEKSLSVGGKN